MKDPVVKDLRPSNYHDIAAKHRKVIPPDLSQSASDQIPPFERPMVTSGLEPYTGEWGAEQVRHLIRRTLFGVKKSDYDHFMTLSMEEAVSSIIQPSASPDPPVNDYQGIEGDDPDVAFGESWLLAPSWRDFEGWRIESQKGWMIKNILQQEATIHEKLILFWHNLLPIQIWEVFIAKASQTYLDMLRRNSLGNFKTMIDELTKNTAMLIYLNGTHNHKDAPDENYARELQELFCVGKGPGSQYTEDDVAAAARVLTGWVVRWENFEQWTLPAHEFLTDWHDADDKNFSSFYDNQLIEGQANFNGRNEFDQLLEMILSTQEASRYICRRLYNFFVYSHIDETTEENVIAPMAEIFRNSGYEIKPVLDALFRSKHFYDAANYGAMIKNPADFLLGLWRSVNLDRLTHGSPQRELIYHRSHLWTMANMGMELGDPPNVAGWPAYHQYPSFDRSWITTDTIKNRAIVTDSLIEWGYWIDENRSIVLDPVVVVEELDHPEDPNLLLRELTDRLLGIPLSEGALAELKHILVTHEEGDHYWTEAWNAYINSRTTANKSVLTNRLKPAFRHILQLGEFQLM